MVFLLKHEREVPGQTNLFLLFDLGVYIFTVVKYFSIEACDIGFEFEPKPPSHAHRQERVAGDGTRAWRRARRSRASSGTRTSSQRSRGTLKFYH
jgi:hypothetical protein